MGQNTMGSEREDLITSEEAAELLNVHVSMIHKMSTTGLLSPVMLRGNKRVQRFYRRSEIAAVASLQLMKLDLSTAANIAIRALAQAQTNERRLEEVRALLGLTGGTLSLREQEVVALHIKVQDDLNAGRASAEEVRDWAKIFLSISEEYLKVVAHHTAAEEPWKAYMLLGDKLSEEAPRGMFSTDKMLEASYSLLEASRKHLRQVSYFYVRNNDGRSAASAQFPGVNGDIDEVLIGLLFLH